MANFRVLIDTSSDAFTRGPAGMERNTEIARILRQLARSLDMGMSNESTVLRDMNGNIVGRAENGLAA